MAKILAVDLGNFNIATSEGVIFSSRYTKGEDIAPGEETIKFDGETYLIGKGNFDNIFNKAKKNYLPNLLYAIAKSTEDENINLVLGVPLDNLGIKDDFKNTLEGKTFNFEFNGEQRIVNIKKLGTIAEGLSSFYTLRKEERERDTLIIDIGGRTVNVCTFVEGKINTKFTHPCGMIDLYDSIKTNINNAEGMNYSLEEMQRLVKNKIYEGNREKEEFVGKMLNAINLKIPNMNVYNIYLTGGGSIELDNELRDLIKNFRFVSDPLFSNVIGNKKIAQLKWR